MHPAPNVDIPFVHTDPLLRVDPNQGNTLFYNKGRQPTTEQEKPKSFRGFLPMKGAVEPALTPRWPWVEGARKVYLTYRTPLLPEAGLLESR
jgi:hypothetical protein